VGRIYLNNYAVQFCNSHMRLRYSLNFYHPWYKLWVSFASCQFRCLQLNHMGAKWLRVWIMSLLYVLILVNNIMECSQLIILYIIMYHIYGDYHEEVPNQNETAEYQGHHIMRNGRFNCTEIVLFNYVNIK
jgi:uncharacterized membrane protein